MSRYQNKDDDDVDGDDGDDYDDADDNNNNNNNNIVIMRKNMYYKHENKAVEEILGCKEG
jgi:hypothetical protein